MDNYEEIIKECEKNNIKMIINSSNLSSINEIISLNDYKNVYYALGFDYETPEKVKKEDIDFLEKQLNNKKVVAIGEIGLDYYWTKDNKDKQIEFFKAQLELAKKYDLPVIIHARESVQDVYDILKESGINKGSMHCYSGSLEMAKEFIKLGFKIGIDGPITYKNNKKGVEVVKNIDLKDLLLETDSPYLSPEPNRGKQNSPLNLIYIAEKIAEIKQISVDEVIKITTNNAKELYKI
jgi:TatD DNase family protein